MHSRNMYTRVLNGLPVKVVVSSNRNSMLLVCSTKCGHCVLVFVYDVSIRSLVSYKGKRIQKAGANHRGVGRD